MEDAGFPDMAGVLNSLTTVDTGEHRVEPESPFGCEDHPLSPGTLSKASAIGCNRI
jgi:hypothetical protein